MTDLLPRIKGKGKLTKESITLSTKTILLIDGWLETEGIALGRTLSTRRRTTL